MTRITVLLTLVLVLGVLSPAPATSLYGVLKAADRYTLVDTVWLQRAGAQERAYRTAQFFAEAGTEDTFDFGAQRWPGGHIRVGYWYETTRMDPVTFVGPVENQWYPLDGGNSEIKFYLADGIEELPGSTLSRLSASPNPFARRTAIRFQLDAPAAAAVHVYDAAGRLLRTLARGRLEAGAHSLDWDGTDADGNDIGPGLYFAELVSGETSRLLKLIRTE